MKLIVAHKAPDTDAITAVWVLRRFDPANFADAKTAFVQSGKTITDEEREQIGISAEDTVHVDTGLGEFDHHQPERGMQRVSAASLVHDYIVQRHPEHAKDWALQQIVEFALAEDHFESFFWDEMKLPRGSFSLPAILRGLEYTGLHDDDSQLQFGMKCLDGAYASLKLWHAAEETILKRGQEIQSKWGKTLLIKTSNETVIKVAQLMGYMLVIQKDKNRGNIRIKAAPYKEMDITKLYERIILHDTIGTWYFHPGRRMLLNGSHHADQKPSPLTLEDMVAILEECR
jgi:hypothetical protein